MCTARKRMKFATKPIWQYPPHFRHVATLPWKIESSNILQIFSRYGKTQTNCILSAPIFNFWHSGALALSPERQSARMSKIKIAGLDHNTAKCQALTGSVVKGLKCRSCVGTVYRRGRRWRSSWSKASVTQAFSSVQSAWTPHDQPVESRLNSHVLRPPLSTHSHRRLRRPSGHRHSGPPAVLPTAVRCRTKCRPNVVPP